MLVPAISISITDASTPSGTVWPSGDSDRSSSATVTGRPESTRISISVMWRSFSTVWRSERPWGCTRSIDSTTAGSASVRRSRSPTASLKALTTQAVSSEPSSAL